MVTDKRGIVNKILLISPNAEGLEDKYAYPPLGLLYIASNLSDKWQADLAILTDNSFNKFDYKYYGISVHSVAVVKETERLIKLILSKNKNATIYIGGSASCLVSRNDRVVHLNGEGEQFFGNVDVSNLDNIKFPNRDLLPRKSKFYKGQVHHTTERSTTIIATRGCVFNCSFCDRVTLGRKFRKRSVENICSEIEEIIGKYGIKWFRFIDDCITLDKKWFIELCKGLEKYKIKWTCLSRADLLDDEIMFHMKQSGCQEIFFGFESGSQKMLDLMNKKSTIDKNKKAIKLCKKFGVASCAYMMFGFPGENEKTVNETIKFLEKTKPDKSRISTFVPIPGTDVWNNPEKYNVKIKDNFQDFWYFDKKDFALDYSYIGNNVMEKLRDKILRFYENNFKETWHVQHS